MKQYALNALIGLDIFVNAILGGTPDETVSARAAKAKQAGRRWGCLLCRFLDALERDHCEDSVKGDVRRANAVTTELENP